MTKPDGSRAWPSTQRDAASSSKPLNLIVSMDNRVMDDSGGGRLIIVCGLPGAGETTYAKALERRLPFVRLCPDEWMDTLSIDLYDETSRGRIEALNGRWASGYWSSVS